jgi:hypothetical protein
MEDFEFKRVKNLATCLAWRKSSKLKIPRWIPDSLMEKNYQNEEYLKKLTIKLITGMVWIKNRFLSDDGEGK